MIKIVFHIIQVVSVIREAHSFTNGDNSGIFGPLCKTLQLAEGTITFSPDLTKATDKAEVIYKLNMTLAPKTWRELLTEAAAAPTKSKAKKQPTPSPADWSSKWDTWTKTALELEAENKEDEVKTTFSIDKASTNQLDQLRPVIAQLADATYELEAVFKLAKGHEPKPDDVLRQNIYSAVYGKDHIDPTQADITAMFTQGATTYDSACATGAAPPATKTLAGTFLCVCGSSQGGGHKACADAQTAAAEWRMAALPEATAWPNLRQICPATDGTVVTADLIANLLNDIMGHSRVHTNDLYVGGLKSENNCDGGTNACCVKITNGARNKQIKQNAIQWVSALDSVASELRKRTSYNSQVTEYNAAITLLKQQVKAVIKRAHYTTTTQATVATGDNSKESKTQLQKEKCNNHKDNANCTENKCKWDSTTEVKGEHCKPKDEERENPGAGTGEQAKEGATTEKCKGKPEKDCKDGYKWENNACKDSSILLTKQFALSVVSAAFVALLF
uniref:Variant surface glycoprotein 328 n=1 Tax=Trypanosoma brucei TaxID=5691 RepID=M4T1I4_9TRYP|nr:variant surface glycoprotein 328 [Trypanosoma brucei]